MNQWIPGVGVGVFKFGEQVEVFAQQFGSVWVPEYSKVEAGDNEYRVETVDYDLEAAFGAGELVKLTVNQQLLLGDVDILGLPPDGLSGVLGHDVIEERYDHVSDARFYRVPALGFKGCLYDGDARFYYALLSAVALG